MEIRYVYYVVYVYERFLDNGTSCCWITRKSKITSKEDMIELGKYICKENNFNKVIILNYKLLREEVVEEE